MWEGRGVDIDRHEVRDKRGVKKREEGGDKRRKK